MPDADDQPSDEALADFADAILEIARRLAPRGQDLRDIVALTGTEIAVIREVHRSARISPTQIAAATGLKRSNVSTALRSLEARGLLERRHPVGNDRSIELVATADAAENLQRVRAIWAQRLRQAPPALLQNGATAAPALQAIADHFAAHPPVQSGEAPAG